MDISRRGAVNIYNVHTLFIIYYITETAILYFICVITCVHIELIKGDIRRALLEREEHLYSIVHP